VKIPAGTKGILAARLFVNADGLTCVWPRWDEDPQGQTVVPGSTSADVSPLKFEGSDLGSSKASENVVALETRPSVALPVRKDYTSYRFAIRLPKGVVFTGPPDDQEAFLGEGGNRVRLRLRYIPGGNRTPLEGILPLLAVGDEIKQTKVKLPSGAIATLVELNLVPESHPGLSDVSRRYLFIPTGRENGDFLVIAAEGSLQAMTSQADTVQAIFSSYAETDR
jgi:hypothetical protein